MNRTIEKGTRRQEKMGKEDREREEKGRKRKEKRKTEDVTNSTDF